MHFLRLLAGCWPGAQSSCLYLLPNIQRLKKTISLTDSATKPFLIWLSTTQPHLKYVATLPYNLSSMACFADINVSQGSVATYASCGGIFNIPLTTNLPRNFPAKFLKKSVRPKI